MQVILPKVSSPPQGCCWVHAQSASISECCELMPFPTTVFGEKKAHKDKGYVNVKLFHIPSQKFESTFSASSRVTLSKLVLKLIFCPLVVRLPHLIGLFPPSFACLLIVSKQIFTAEKRHTIWQAVGRKKGAANWSTEKEYWSPG